MPILNVNSLRSGLSIFQLIPAKKISTCPLTRMQSRPFTQLAGSTPWRSLIDRVKSAPFSPGIITGLILVPYFPRKDDLYRTREQLEQKCIDLAAAYRLKAPLLLTPNERLVTEILYTVRNGDFEKAKNLLEVVDGDLINTEKNCYTRWNASEVLLEGFYPHTEDDLNQFMDFINFALARGYKHINRSIDGREGRGNLLTEIYNQRMFKDNSGLRRRFIAFLLEKGVDPLYKSSFLGTPLQQAYFHGDGRFFIRLCDNLKIPLNLKEMNEKDSSNLISCAILSGEVDDLLILLRSGIKIGDKNKILESLNSSAQYSPQDLKAAKKAIKEAM